VEKVSPAKIRAAMGPLIELIRFPTMSAQEFNSVVGLFGLNE
jgi:hypothetical protein